MAMMIVLDKNKVKEMKTALEVCNYYDHGRKIVNLSDTSVISLSCSASTEKFALPVTEICSKKFLSLQEKGTSLPHPFDNCIMSELHLPPSIRENPKEKLRRSIVKLLSESVCDEELDKMIKSTPVSWERHGDLVILPHISFSGHLWLSYLDSLSESRLTNFWSVVSTSLKCRRLAIGSKVSDDNFRSPKVTLVLCDDGWVDHVDNGIHYVFDVTKCMFSTGNITEKIRLGSLDCSGETVVDLYAGIGYFVLPYLIQAGAEMVHACEWNPDAVEALRRGLKANGVQDRCVIHYGDNRKCGLSDIADRVNVGLIPSSEEGWPTACAALKCSTGGWLHVHGNVSTKPLDNTSEVYVCGRYSHLISSKCLRCVSVTKWIGYVVERISVLLKESKMKSWSVEVRHVEHVKSYAPHISHLVLDLECRPQYFIYN